MRAFLLVALVPVAAGAYTAPSSSRRSTTDLYMTQDANANRGRRAFLASALTTAATFAPLAVPPQRALADDEQKLTDVYFGVGCFWHIQHEFVEAERKLLKRTDKELTSKAGYAGGTKTDGQGRVCYHNLKSIADYGKLGHGEVVGMTIPEAYIGDFAKEYFSLFRKGERVDPQDRGAEYRSLLGLPGGENHPMFPAVEAAATANGMTLAKGKGNDPDTLGKKLVYVMDTAQFPFYQAEVYHQFHNDFQSPAYGRAYNSLADEAYNDGRIKDTGCPDRVLPSVGKIVGTATKHVQQNGAWFIGGMSAAVCFSLVLLLLKRHRDATWYAEVGDEKQIASSVV